MNSEISFDIAVIGGGVNSIGIARDADEKETCVLLLEQGGLAHAQMLADLFHQYSCCLAYQEL